MAAEHSADSFHLANLSHWFLFERLRAYENAIRRVRWLLLITTLLSSLILIKVYLEQWGFQEHQLSTVYEFRITSGKNIGSHLEIENKYDKLFAAYADSIRLATVRKDNAAKSQYMQKVKEISKERYVYEVTNNTLADSRIKDQSLPLLGTAIPGNDYVPILAIMLSVFAVSVWLNIRSIWVAVWDLLQVEEPADSRDMGNSSEKNNALVQSPNLKERLQFVRIIRLHFTFTGTLDKNIESPFGQWVATGLELAAYWLPFAALIIGSWMDLAPVISENRFHVGPPDAIAVRVVILFVTILAAALSGLSSTSMSRRVDYRIRRYLNHS